MQFAQMNASLRYGVQEALELDLPADRLIACCGAPADCSLGDVEAATSAALESPLDFPPLSRAVVPGDHVVLALDHDVPRGARWSRRSFVTWSRTD